MSTNAKLYIKVLKMIRKLYTRIKSPSHFLLTMAATPPAEYFQKEQTQKNISSVMAIPLWDGIPTQMQMETQ